MGATTRPALVFARALGTAAWAGLFALLACPLHAASWAPAVEADAGWDDNLTNANRSADQIGGLTLRLDATTATRIGIARNDSLHFTGRFATDWTPRFDALREHALGGRAGWQHKFGLGPLAPTIALEVSLDAMLAGERDREGTSTGARLALRKRFVDIWQVSLTQDFARHEARSAVFDREARETILAVDRPVGDTWQLTVSASYRDGDIVSYATPPRPDLAPLAPDRVPMTTFGRSMVAYPIDASSVAGRLAIARPIGDTSSLTIAYTHRETRRSPLSYVNNLVSVGFARRF